MPRPKKVIPDYQSHISGQARVYLDGRYYYLGSYDSPESKARYAALLATYTANGQRMPDASKGMKESDSQNVGLTRRMLPGLAVWRVQRLKNLAADV
jgi:hypothetical protein